MRIAFLTFVLLSNFALASELDDVESLSRKIEIGISVGVSKQEVELFLQQTTWGYTYDRFANRYQAVPVDGTAECKGRNILLWLMYDCHIQIHINLDKTGKFSGYTVEQSYMGL